MNILESIHSHSDLTLLDAKQRVVLCQEIREFLVERVSKTGGHLASNLGVVELTVAIETVFDTSKDRLVFDVGHQSYVHKILTGRQDGFKNLRQFGGMAGFPKPSESVTDAFVAGHSSSSISIGLGMARARTLQNQDYHIISLIGDGAATGGMVYEGLNDAAVSNEPFIVILNDNAMSIDRNVGGMATYLSKLRTKKKYLRIKRKYRSALFKIPGGSFVFQVTRKIKDMVRRMLIPETLFECIGFSYLGPVDGHDTENMIELLKIAKDMKCPVLLHVLTKKGKGYLPSEEHPKLFHGVGKFDPITGEVPSKGIGSFSDVFGRTMCQLAEENQKVCTITAAMPGGTGLLEFKNQFPDRMFDVGIAEEHAVSMACGLAKQGMVPVVALYSTFLQRSYDMILQDICMLKLHVVLAIDRAGLVGEDGETHHGVFDVGFLRQAPSMKILCPASLLELEDMMRYAVLECEGPVAVRYPRGTDGAYKESAWKDGDANHIVQHLTGDYATIITYGSLINCALDAAKILLTRNIPVTVIRLLSVDAPDVRKMIPLISKNRNIFIIEEVSGNSGVAHFLSHDLHSLLDSCNIHVLDLGNEYVTHGSVNELRHLHGIDGESVADHIQEVIGLES